MPSDLAPNSRTLAVPLDLQTRSHPPAIQFSRSGTPVSSCTCLTYRCNPRSSSPQTRCAHSPSGSPVPADRPCSSAAISCHLLCSLVSKPYIYASSTQKLGYIFGAYLLQYLAILDDAFDLLDHERGDAHYNTLSALPSHSNKGFQVNKNGERILSFRISESLR